MFWRFGSDDDSRPVAATAWWKVVCRRPSDAMSTGQRLDVGRPELRVGPPVEDRLDHRVDRPELLEHRGVGRVPRLRLAPERQLELAEQHLAELLRRPDRELVSDRVVDRPLETSRSPSPNSRSSVAERLEIERDARRLHPREDRDQRELQLARRAGRGRRLRGRRSSGWRTAAAASASRPARVAASSSFGCGSWTSSRSAATSAIAWLRSEALRT